MAVLDEMALMEAQRKVHEQIAKQDPIEDILSAIAHWVEMLLPGAVVAFMRFDPQNMTLTLISSHHFSSAYQACLQAVPIGPDAASFGSAAYYRTPVITDDIGTDPCWEAFRDVAEREGLRACWSNPLLTSEGELLGTFGTYFREACSPTNTSWHRLKQAVALIALAILRDRDATFHKALSAWHRALFMNHPDGVCTLDLEGRFQHGNAVLSHNCPFLQGLDIGAECGCSHYIDLQQDTIRQREQEVLIAYQATHDVLTGLPNRLAFDEKLKTAFEQANNDQGLLAVMCFNLDRFKLINDGLGHHIGDQLLVAISERLCQLINETGTLARIAGDEFALLCPNLDSRQSGVEMAERVLNGLSQPFLIENWPLHLSASMGIACNHGNASYADELMYHANLAVTDAKQLGRNTWHWYQEDAQRLTEDAALLRYELYVALQKDQFELHYQPIVDAVSGRIRGLEALIRWHHPERGMVSPWIFITLAEQTGQIIALGRWVLHRACQDAVAMGASGERVVPVAVNISSLQLRRDDFLTDIHAALDNTGLPPELLELEITESVLLDGADQAIELIRTLKAMGIRIALDDFGTGFSSLSYLRDLPIHKVKLDREFIQDIDLSNNAVIVQDIITMGHHLDLVVVAEGVEEWGQQQRLSRLSCDLLQGFYFAKPMPREAVMALPDLLPVPTAF